MDSENKLDNFLSQYKLPLILGLVGIVLLIGGIVSSGIISRTFVKSSKYPPKVVSQSSYVASTVKVDVSGQVQSPGVYILPVDSRVEDALKAAGGITEEADGNFLSKSLNLAQKVSDGMKVYVPKEGEVGQVSQALPAGRQGAVAGTSLQTQTSLVNINSDSMDRLESLPGVGPVTAQKIIDKRPYGGIEELLTKKAVSRATYEKIKELVSVY